MDKQDIIRMARKAGLLHESDTAEIISDCGVEVWLSPSEGVNTLERFAALVAAGEREAILKLAETPIGEYEVVVACGTEPETKRIPRYLEGQFLIKAIRARGNT